MYLNVGILGSKGPKMFLLHDENLLLFRYLYGIPRDESLKGKSPGSSGLRG